MLLFLRIILSGLQFLKLNCGFLWILKSLRESQSSFIENPPDIFGVVFCFPYEIPASFEEHTGCLHLVRSFSVLYHRLPEERHLP